MQKSQVRTRRILQTPSLQTVRLPRPGTMPDELKAAIVLFFTLLDEKQRRLHAGWESPVDADLGSRLSTPNICSSPCLQLPSRPQLICHHRIFNCFS